MNDIIDFKQVVEMQDKLLPLTDDDLDIVNTFTEGLYSRSGTMRQGSLIIGHIHKHSCINIMSTGKMIVNMDGVTTTIEAPCVFSSPSGSRKVLLVLEDVTFTNVHNTETTDLDELRKELVVHEDFLPDLSHIKKELVEYYNEGELICG